MTEFDLVLAHPRSLAARRSLLQKWIEVNDPRAQLLERALAARDGDVAAIAESPRLVRKLGRELAGPIAAEVEGFEFGMGLVTWIKTSADQFVRRSAELLSQAPVTALLIVDEPKRDVLVLPKLGQVIELGFYGPGVDDDLARAIAASPHCHEIRTLTLSPGEITTAGLQALANSKSFPNLISIELTGNPCAVEVTQVKDQAFFLGPAAAEYWAKARDDQFHSSDSFNPANFFWPPSFDSYAWTE